MTKEELLKLREKISKLSEEEQKLRDFYLRDLANGTLQGPPVGYPSIDKSWLKYYSEQEISADYDGQTFYNFLYENNKYNLNGIALKYFNLKITYRELFEKIDECARALIGIGIKNGDVVGICAPTTPETVYLLYALNKIGAIANLIDIRKKSEDIEYCLNIHDEEIAPVKLLFVYDGQVERINQFITNTSVEKVVALSPLQSLPDVVRFAYNPKLYVESLSKKKNFYNFNEFIRFGKNVEKIDVADYEKNKVTFIEYTSGSTGKPKAVALCDSTGNHRVFQYMHNGMSYEKGDTYLNIIPIFLAFGAFVGIHLPLSMGMTDELIPSFDAKKIYSYFSKSDAKHMTLTPASFVELIHDKKFDKLNLSRMQTLGCGGDGFNAEGERIVVENLRKCGCMVPLNNGYGCSEIGAPFCTQKNDIAKYGSVGIPLPGNNIVILKHNTLDEVPVDTIGDVCMVVDYPMLRYIGDKINTENVMIRLPDSRIGIRLEDAGYVDKDGNIFIKGRYDNAFFKEDKYIWPVDIENLVMKSGMVKMCSIVPIKDDYYDGRLFIVPEKNWNENILNIYLNILDSTGLRIDIRYVDSLNLTSSGKIDRKKMKTL